VAEDFPAGLADSGSPPQIGSYQVVEEIGRGGMAIVYRARDVRLGRWVALKVLAEDLARDDGFRRRFIRESRAAAAVDHPNIIPIFDAGEAGGVLFIAMRYVRGGDVRSVVSAHGPLPPRRAAEIIAQVAAALDAAHVRGLVHRDVKPANMLLDASSGAGRPDHVYLSDFGLSKAALAASALTGTGEFLGTADYVAPEQIDGRGVDGRADEYALACAAFELLSGAPPFQRGETMAVIYAHLYESPPPLTGRRPDLPPAVDLVFARALAKTPAERYPSCREFSDAARAALGIPPFDYGADPAQVPPRSPTQLARPVTEIAAGAEPSGADGVPAAGAGSRPAPVTLPRVSPAPAGPFPVPAGPAAAPSGPATPLPTMGAGTVTPGPPPGGGAWPVDAGPPPTMGAGSVDTGPLPTIGAGSAVPGPPPGGGAPVRHRAIPPAGGPPVGAPPMELRPTRDQAAGAGGGRRRRRRGRRAAAVAGASVAVLALAAAAVVLVRLNTHGGVTPPGPCAAGQRPAGAPRPVSPASYRLTRTLAGPGTARDLVEAAAFSPSGATLAVGNDNGSTYLWDPATGRQTGTLTGPRAEGVLAVAFSCAHATLAVGDKNGSAYLWDVATQRLTATMTDPATGRRGVQAVAFSPDGKLLAAGDSDGSTYLRDVATGRVTATLTDPATGQGDVQAVAFSRDGKLLAAGDSDGSTYLWDLATGRVRATLTDPATGRGGVQAVAFSSDGSLLAAGDFNGSVELWDVTTGRTTGALPDPNPGNLGVVAVAFGPGADFVAAGDSDGDVYLWNIVNGHLARIISGPARLGVQALAFTPDGTTLAVGDVNGNTYLWSAR
jgi:serine/threonine-protein kinase